GVVGEELHGELVVGVRLVPGVAGLLVGVLLRPGQSPDGEARRRASPAAGLLAAAAGAEACQRGDRQAEAREGCAASGLHHCCLQITVRHSTERFRKLGSVWSSKSCFRPRVKRERLQGASGGPRTASLQGAERGAVAKGAPEKWRKLSCCSDRRPCPAVRESGRTTRRPRLPPGTAETGGVMR